MKAAEYRAWLARHELTHEAAGKALGLHKSTSKRYGDGSIAIPLSIELAIEALEARWQLNLSRADQIAFAKALIKPAAPTAKLRAAKRRHAATIKK
jgi:Protein of unknown function (DUF1778)